MNRLEKKCFITAASAHGLLFLILLVGPGFFMQTPRTPPSVEITAYDPNKLSEALSGGEQQNVRAIPLPLPPAQVQETKPVVTPPPVIPPKQESKPEVKDLDVKPPTKIKPLEKGDEPVVKPKTKPKHVVQIDDNEFQPSKADSSAAQKKAVEEARERAQARAAADARHQAQIAKEYGNALKSLSQNLSGSTEVKFQPGAGGGGAAAINYFDMVKSRFDSAWNPSSTLSDTTPKVTISIIISRNGTIRGHITKRSGVASMDRSVQNALDTVTSVDPFPPSFSEPEITGSLTFDIQAKR